VESEASVRRTGRQQRDSGLSPDKHIPQRSDNRPNENQKVPDEKGVNTCDRPTASKRNQTSKEEGTSPEKEREPQLQTKGPQNKKPQEVTTVPERTQSSEHQRPIKNKRRGKEPSVLENEITKPNQSSPRKKPEVEEGGRDLSPELVKVERTPRQKPNEQHDQRQPIFVKVHPKEATINRRNSQSPNGSSNSHTNLPVDNTDEYIFANEPVRVGDKWRKEHHPVGKRTPARVVIAPGRRRTDALEHGNPGRVKNAARFFDDNTQGMVKESEQSKGTKVDSGPYNIKDNKSLPPSQKNGRDEPRFPRSPTKEENIVPAMEREQLSSRDANDGHDKPQLSPRQIYTFPTEKTASDEQGLVKPRNKFLHTYPLPEEEEEVSPRCTEDNTEEDKSPTGDATPEKLFWVPLKVDGVPVHDPLFPGGVLGTIPEEEGEYSTSKDRTDYDSSAVVKTKQRKPRSLARGISPDLGQAKNAVPVVDEGTQSDPGHSPVSSIGLHTNLERTPVNYVNNGLLQEGPLDSGLPLQSDQLNEEPVEIAASLQLDSFNKSPHRNIIFSAPAQPLESTTQSPVKESLESRSRRPAKMHLVSCTQRPTETPLESSTQTPVKIPLESSTQTPFKLPLDSGTQTPVKTPLESGTQTLVKLPLESSTQTPTHTPLECSSQTAVVRQMEFSTQTTFDIPLEIQTTTTPLKSSTQTTMLESGTQTPSGMPLESDTQTTVETPLESSTQIPIENPESSFETPLESTEKPMTSIRNELLESSDGDPIMQEEREGFESVDNEPIVPGDKLPDGANDKATADARGEELVDRLMVLETECDHYSEPEDSGVDTPAETLDSESDGQVLEGYAGYEVVPEELGHTVPEETNEKLRALDNSPWEEGDTEYQESDGTDDSVECNKTPPTFEILNFATEVSLDICESAMPEAAGRCFLQPSDTEELGHNISDAASEPKASHMRAELSEDECGPLELADIEYQESDGAVPEEPRAIEEQNALNLLEYDGLSADFCDSGPEEKSEEKVRDLEEGEEEKKKSDEAKLDSLQVGLKEGDHFGAPESHRSSVDSDENQKLDYTFEQSARKFSFESPEDQDQALDRHLHSSVIFESQEELQDSDDYEIRRSSDGFEHLDDSLECNKTPPTFEILNFANELSVDICESAVPEAAGISFLQPSDTEELGHNISDAISEPEASRRTTEVSEDEFAVPFGSMERKRLNVDDKINVDLDDKCCDMNDEESYYNDKQILDADSGSRPESPLEAVGNIDKEPSADSDVVEAVQNKRQQNSLESMSNTTETSDVESMEDPEVLMIFFHWVLYL
jgi:hypothetical protein